MLDQTLSLLLVMDECGDEEPNPVGVGYATILTGR